MKQILLISESHLKEQSLIEMNVDAKVLSRVISTVQTVQLQPILGKEKYDELIASVDEYVTNETAIAEATKTLLNSYIIPFLIHATIADFIVLNNFKLTNKGVLKMTDASSQNVDNNSLEYIKNYYDNYLAVYKNRLVEYLNTDNCSTNDTDVTSLSIGWFLEK